jgi:hypothetical protein
VSQHPVEDMLTMDTYTILVAILGILVIGSTLGQVIMNLRKRRTKQR